MRRWIVLAIGAACLSASSGALGEDKPAPKATPAKDAKPAKGDAAKPAPADAAKPAQGDAAKPAPADAVKGAAGDAAKPAPADAAKGPAGDAAKPAPADPAKPADAKPAPDAPKADAPKPAPAPRQPDPPPDETGRHCSGIACIRYDIAAASFVGGKGPAILLLPLGFDISARVPHGLAVAAEIGGAFYGPGLNVFGFVRDTSRWQPGQCTSGNPLCAAVLGAAMVQARARFAEAGGGGLAVFAAYGYLATALPLEVHDDFGGFFGVELTPR